MLALLAAACVAGFAYNAASPLGVRAALKTAPSAPAKAPSIYQNQTLSLALETDIPPADALAAIPAQLATNQVSWADTKKFLAAGQILLIDARATNYFNAEHIPGAVSLYALSTAGELAEFAARHPRKDTPIVIYCNSARCSMAQYLALILTRQWAYTNVREMVGGFVEYRLSETQASREKTF